jgi:hypothetical protein
VRLNSSTPSSRERHRRPLTLFRNVWREHLGWPAAAGLIALTLAALPIAWTLRSGSAAPPSRSTPAQATRPGLAVLPGNTADQGAAPRSLALRQAQDLDRLLALAHRLGLAMPDGQEHSRLEAPPPAFAPGGSGPAGGEGWLHWRVDLRLQGLPTALDAFVAALAQELPHARIDRIAWPTSGAASGVTNAAELSLSLRYRGMAH